MAPVSTTNSSPSSNISALSALSGIACTFLAEENRLSAQSHRRDYSPHLIYRKGNATTKNKLACQGMPHDIRRYRYTIQYSDIVGYAASHIQRRAKRARDGVLA